MPASGRYAQIVSQLTALKGYRYRLISYSISHSKLVLQATDPGNDDPPLRIPFELVLFIQISVSWRSSNFRLGSEAERQAMLQKANIKLPPDSQLVSLFIAETPTTPVYILEQLGTITPDTELPWTS